MTRLAMVYHYVLWELCYGAKQDVQARLPRSKCSLAMVAASWRKAASRSGWGSEVDSLYAWSCDILRREERHTLPQSLVSPVPTWGKVSRHGVSCILSMARDARFCNPVDKHPGSRIFQHGRCSRDPERNPSSFLFGTCILL